MSITAAAKRGKKFKDVPTIAPPKIEGDPSNWQGLLSTTLPAGIIKHDPSAKEPDDYLLTDAAAFLEHSHPWIAQMRRDLRPLLAIAEEMQKRWHKTFIGEVGSVRLHGEGPTLLLRDKLTDTVVRTWDWAVVAAEVIGHRPTPALKTPLTTRKPHRELAKQVATGLMIPLAQLQRHPENRKPTEAKIAERAASLKEDGQLEELQVRQIADGAYQIISGETRYLAAKSLGWTQLRCTVKECDDAEALRLVGLFNGQRTDLNPIQKALHIEAMCAQGSSREEAARCVGLESGSAASNLVRLLKLPKVWQERVIAGELPESWARLLVPVAHVAAVMAEIDKRFKKRDRWETLFNSRDELERGIEKVIQQMTRRLDDTKRYYGHDCGSLLSYDQYGDFSCLLSADEIEANRAKLHIVTLTVGDKGKTQDVEVATNVKLFDDLQCRLIKAKHAAKAKGKAAAAGKKADAGEQGPAPKSKEQIKHDLETRKRQLATSIENWRESLLRREVQRVLLEFKPTKQFDTRLLKLVMFYLCDGTTGAVDLEGQFHKLLGVDGKGRRGMNNLHSLLTPMLDVDTAHFRWQKVAAQLCAFLVNGDADSRWKVELWPETLQGLFDEWGCDLTAAWRKLHAGKDPLIEEFLELHRKDELRALGKELVPDLHLAESLGKPQMIKLILGRTLPPAVPGVLLPAKKREAKAAGKRGGK